MSAVATLERVFGVRADAYRSARVGSAAGLVLPAPAASVDLRSQCPWVDDQLGERCVGEALAGSHCLATQNRGKKLSPRGVWTAARAREHLRKSDPFTDVGCNPQDALDALIVMGGYPVDAKDDDPAALNDPWNWAEALGTKKFSPDDFLPIDPGDLDTVDAVLTAGFGVAFWMPVSDSFLSLRGATVWTGIQPGEVIRGGHAQTLVGYPDRRSSYRVWGSYGRGFGDNGFPNVAREVVATSIGMVAVVGGPVL